MVMKSGGAGPNIVPRVARLDPEEFILGANKDEGSIQEAWSGCPRFATGRIFERLDCLGSSAQGCARTKSSICCAIGALALGASMSPARMCWPSDSL